jgi:hypothetical protein
VRATVCSGKTPQIAKYATKTIKKAIDEVVLIMLQLTQSKNSLRSFLL